MAMVALKSSIGKIVGEHLFWNKYKQNKQIMPKQNAECAHGDFTLIF